MEAGTHQTSGQSGYELIANRVSSADTDLSPAGLADRIVTTMRAFNKDVDAELVRKAVDMAVEYHGSQKRHSGEPYYYHPIAVAEIIAGLQLDASCVITGILHDTVEDTELTLNDIEQHFGKEIATLVDGVTKLTQIEFKSDNHKQAENFRKFLLASSEDIRVLLVKLCDRLHNMRTLGYINRESKRVRIARETMEIYATLAERIGLHAIKGELQDRSFRELNPDAYTSILSRLEFLREEGGDVIDKTVAELKGVMEEAGLNATVTGREKSPYSIWVKMQKKNLPFEQMSDIVAFRLILDSEIDCYTALGYIHSQYHALPDHFKDYISTPKNNGYQSIHTVVMGPEQQRIEIQLRTREMHEVAELGVAAHWAYKQGEDAIRDGKQFRWMRELLQIIENARDSEEFLENTKLAMYHDQVFCFTPKGDLIVLPHGATPVDFAFAVHTQVGYSCVGAKINGRIMPLRTQLKNGDQIEILLSKSQHPSPAWEHFVVTGKALSEIRKYIRTTQVEEYKALGKEMLEKSLKSEKLKVTQGELEKAAKALGKKDLDDLYLALGDGTLQRIELLRKLFPDRFEKKKQSATFFDRFRRRTKKHGAENERLPIPIRGLVPGMAIHFAGCCHPLPGERIVGIVNTGKGVTIHTDDCHELEQFVDSPERWLDVTWDLDATGGTYVGRLKAIVHHKKGALAEFSNAIAQSEGNIHNIRITDRSTNFFEMLVDVEVSDVEHLTKLIAMLRTRPVVHTIDRYTEGRRFDG